MKTRIGVTVILSSVLGLAHAQESSAKGEDDALSKGFDPAIMCVFEGKFYSLGATLQQVDRTIVECTDRNPNGDEFKKVPGHWARKRGVVS
ncbi:hypothetical protein [Pokkaliibacter plantistimulans]|uniref:hypothetical protein n=1 Tax=Pokkaliibacter plantistimulans TaxID=1635171 RepID=UPI001057F60B|nr:hypothetical protein [Pokkaliibacter plantistimulans]